MKRLKYSPEQVQIMILGQKNDSRVLLPIFPQTIVTKSVVPKSLKGYVVTAHYDWEPKGHVNVKDKELYTYTYIYCNHVQYT